MPDEPSVLNLALDAVEPDPDNVRRSIGDVAELARSIAAVGVIEPCLVVPLDTDPPRYRLVAGHRRHAAARAAGLAEVPCLVRRLTEAEVVETQLVENLQRAGLTVLEEAGAYLRLCALGSTVRRLAKRVGRPERHVRERLSLLELPPAAQAAIDAGEVSLADAKVLVVAKDHPEVIEAVLAEHPRDVAWALKRALRQEAAGRRRAELEAELAAAGVRVLADEGSRPKGYTTLGDLGIDEAAHAGEDCHAVVVVTGHEGPVALACCTDRRRHAKAGRSELKAEREADPLRAAERRQAAERRRTAQARGEFVADRLRRRLPRGPAVAFVVAAVVERANGNDAARATQALGIEPDAGPYGPDHKAALRRAAATGDPDGLAVAVAVAAGQAEAAVASSSVLGPLGRRYLGLLADLGYSLDQTEHDALAEAGRREAQAAGEDAA